MGAGESATDRDVALAERLGALVAAEGWIVLCGGRPSGVMAAVARGAARTPGGLVVGILPGAGGPVAEGVDVAVFTGLGGARNAVNVLSSDVVVACGHGGAGTASEIALALKAGKPVVLLAPSVQAEAFFRSLPGARPATAAGADEAIEAIRAALEARGGALR